MDVQSPQTLAHEEEVIVDVHSEICRRCGAWARDGSIYCSHACGIAVHMDRIAEEQQKKLMELKTARHDIRCKVIWSELEESMRTNTYATIMEEEDASMLLKVQSDLALEKVTIEGYKADRLKAETTIQSYQIDCPEHKDDDSEERTSAAKNSAHFDCPYCGIQPTTAILSLHLPGCYQKFESTNQIYGDAPTPAGDVTSLIYCDHHDHKTGKYCKKLKESCYAHSGVLAARLAPGHRARGPEYCGAPTAEDPSGHCHLVRSRCARHFNWEHIILRQYDLQIISHTQLAEALKLELELIKDRMITSRLARGLRGNSRTIPAGEDDDLSSESNIRKGKRKVE